MRKSYGELQGAGCRDEVVRGEARAGREACVGRRAKEAGTVLRLHAGELLRNLPEEYFSSNLTIPASGKHGSLTARVNGLWL